MSKVVFKMTFKHPNLKDSKSKNMAHVNYISMRSGVDKSITEGDLEKEIQKGVENLSSDDETYVKYINERPKSHGLFGADGIEDPEEIKEELREINSCVWRAIVSLKEEDAKNLNYLNKNQWQLLLRKKIPDMANEMNIRTTNLRWVAAVHMEKGHPHAHIMFWEKEPERTLGIINTKSLDNIRKIFTDEVFAEERFQLLNEKNLMRDLINDLANNDISNASKLIREVNDTGTEIEMFIKDMEREGVVPRIYKGEEIELTEKIRNLADMLPGSGRISLKFMPPEVKKEVRTIAEYLLEKPEFSASLEKNLKAVEELTRLYTSDEKAILARRGNYEHVISNISASLSDLGIERDNILHIIKEWNKSQINDINIPTNDINKILDEIDIKENKFYDEKHRDYFNNIAIQILDKHSDINIKEIKDKYIEDKFSERNIDLNELLDKDLIKLENNAYTLTDKSNEYYKTLEGLNDYEKEILKILVTNNLSTEELLENRNLKYLTDASISNSSKVFELKKYDATIIKDYFGKDNNFNVDELKESINKKYNSEDKKNEEYRLVTNRIKKLLDNNIVVKNGDNYSFGEDGLRKLENVNVDFTYTSYDANVVDNYIDKAGGTLSRDQLLKFLNEEYTEKKEIDRQFKYLINRLTNNVESEYVAKTMVNGIEAYSITDKGKEAREEILNPSKYKLKNILNELEKKQLIGNIEDNKYCINDGIKNILTNKELDNIKNSGANVADTNQRLTDKIIGDIESADISYTNIKDILKLKDNIDPIAKARDNAYEDIVKRVSQVILKGALESNRKNIFYVNPELADKTIDCIKKIDEKINLISEQKKVLNEIAVTLIKTGHSYEDRFDKLNSFAKREKLDLTSDDIEDVIIRAKENQADIKILDNLSNKNKVEHYLSILKLVGYNEEDAFKLIGNLINVNNEDLKNKLENLKSEGYLKSEGNNYKLTNQGIEEFLKVKNLDKVENEILKMVDKFEDESKNINFKDILDNTNVTSNLKNRDPEEFKVSKYDLKVREQFGEDNKITLKELESRIYGKYTEDEINNNSEKIESEIEYFKSRIDKLTINGYVKLDKISGEYSFTEEAIKQLAELKDKMEFTRYDANVTLSYLEHSENEVNGVLTSKILRNILEKEIVNKNAARQFNKFTDLLEHKIDIVKQYLNIDANGKISSNAKGKSLGIELNKINNYFFKGKGSLTEEKLREICIKESGEGEGLKQFKDILARINKQIDKGNIVQDKDTGIFKLNADINNINRLLYQIYKEGGSIQKDKLKEILEKNIPNKQAESQYKYLIKRLEFLKKEGYLTGEENTYSITNKGIDKREDILHPERELLRSKLKYLERLGLLTYSDKGYKIDDNYSKILKNISESREGNIKRESDILSKDVANLIDRTQDNIDIGKVERTNEKIAKGLFINNRYDELENDYESIREYCGIDDTKKKVLHNLATMLVVAGVDLDATKDIINEWNLKSRSQIKDEFINEIVEDAYDEVEESKLWGNTKLISTKEWKATFESFGVKQEDIPKWMYAGENWQSFTQSNFHSIIADIWKSIWKQLEIERNRTQAQAEMIKRNMVKQQAISQNKSAMKEQARKHKDKSSMYQDHDFEL